MEQNHADCKVAGGRGLWRGDRRIALMSLPESKNGFGPGDHLFLIDASGYLYRAFHALPPLTRASDGMPVGALAGFAAMLHKLLAGLKGEETPTHIAVVFDAKGPTFREKLFPAYKANREAMPEALRPQMALARRAVAAFGLAGVEAQGVEADDLIASYVRHAVGGGARTDIISSDKDLMQLVGPQVRMIDTMKGSIIGPAEVEAKFGLPPGKVVEIQALAGDSSDNIPGAPGIGVKTAALLLRDFGSLDALLARAEEIRQPKRRAALLENLAQIKISRQLATLKQDCPLPLPAAQLRYRSPTIEPLLDFLREMEFRTLTRRIAKELNYQGDLNLTPVRAQAKKGKAAASGPGALQGRSLEDAAETQAAAMNALDYAPRPPVLKDVASLAAWAEKIKEGGMLGLAIAGSQSAPAGLGLAASPGETAYLPLGGGIAPALLNRRFAPLLADPCITKYVLDAKQTLHALAQIEGLALCLPAALEDIGLISYGFRTAGEAADLSALTMRHLGCMPPQPSALPTEKRGEKRGEKFDFAALNEEQAAFYTATRADMVLRLGRILTPLLVLAGKSKLYRHMDLPLTFVLKRMERRGVKLDTALLARLSESFAIRLEAIAQEIYTQAGEEFNLASPKQIADILFTRLGLRGGRKTRTGQWSTEAGFLEDLAAQGESLPAKILDWRHLAKLKSTYTDALPAFVNPETGRVHTRYAMRATLTGRLASADPNLQNIPIRSQEGRSIRRAFIAAPGKLLLSADYSQIELRVLAVLAQAESLQQAFAAGQDIHTATAAELFSLPVDKVDAAARRRAKAVNFGLIYGQTRYGLARSLRISHAEAQSYIDAYDARFPEIRDYMRETVERCRNQGYVETLFGRRCHFPLAGGGRHRAHLERAAINAPVQGTAADLMRRAMNRMEAALAQAGLQAAMLLQIHDELIFELPEAEIEAAGGIIREVMEKAAEPVLVFPVALQVDIGKGGNWDAAH